MNDTRLETIEQIEAFLTGAETVELIIVGKADRYAWILRTLIRLKYSQLSKSEKGLVMRYLRKMTGYSPAQMKRLIKQYRETGRLVRKQGTVKRFSQMKLLLDEQVPRQLAASFPTEFEVRTVQQMGWAGEFTSDDLLAEIFSSFCIGK